MVRVSRVTVAGSCMATICRIVRGGSCALAWRVVSRSQCSRCRTAGWPCATRGRCVVLEPQGSECIISAIDAVRGKGRELFRMPTSSGGANLSPDGDHFAFIVPERTGPMNHIRILSSRGEPPRDVAVQNAARLISLDWLPSGAGFFSHDTGSGRPRLLFITIEGQLRVLWVPTDLALESAIPSPDGKHVAINVKKRHSNAWLMTGL